jgi:hypothetical protein
VVGGISLPKVPGASRPSTSPTSSPTPVYFERGIPGRWRCEAAGGDEDGVGLPEPGRHERGEGERLGSGLQTGLLAEDVPEMPLHVLGQSRHTLDGRPAQADPI